MFVQCFVNCATEKLFFLVCWLMAKCFCIGDTMRAFWAWAMMRSKYVVVDVEVDWRHVSVLMHFGLIVEWQIECYLYLFFFFWLLIGELIRCIIFIHYAQSKRCAFFLFWVLCAKISRNNKKNFFFLCVLNLNHIQKIEK